MEKGCKYNIKLSYNHKSFKEAKINHKYRMIFHSFRENILEIN